MKLMGVYEIADLAGVSAQAVSNWVARRDDFPEPIARLASGNVWDGDQITKWLKDIGTLKSSNKREKAMKSFVEGSDYSLVEIRDVIGGETMTYLPQVGKRIVCGRFTRAMNPDAPHEVLVGNPHRVQMKAELMEEQGGSIPIFVKEVKGSTSWRYQGDMKFASYSTDSKIYGPKARAAGRDDVVGVIFFKRDR